MKRRVLTYPTPFGDGWIEYDADGVAALGLPGKDLPAVPADEAPQAIRDVATSLTEYWDGAPLPKAPAALMDRASTTNLMARIYEVVTSIPAGSTLTYAEVARRAGRPGAARAVGAAMARNPMAPVIPCHRVVGTDGTLRGYGGGLKMKQALLDMEAQSA